MSYQVTHENQLSDVTAKYMPTQEQIAASSAEVRAKWSEYEKRKRSGAADAGVVCQVLPDRVFMGR